MNIDETLDWRIWSKNDLVEERTYLRAKNELPEMESAKQLRQIIKSIDEKETVLDVGCASGHYLRSIRSLSKNCKYLGVDATDTSNSQYALFSSKVDMFSPNGLYQLLLEAKLENISRNLPMWQLTIATICWTFIPSSIFIWRFNKLAV